MAAPLVHGRVNLGDISKFSFGSNTSPGVIDRSGPSEAGTDGERRLRLGHPPYPLLL